MELLRQLGDVSSVAGGANVVYSLGNDTVAHLVWGHCGNCRSHDGTSPKGKFHPLFLFCEFSKWQSESCPIASQTAAYFFNILNLSANSKSCSVKVVLIAALQPMRAPRYTTCDLLTHSFHYFSFLLGGKQSACQIKSNSKRTWIRTSARLHLNHRQCRPIRTVARRESEWWRHPTFIKKQWKGPQMWIRVTQLLLKDVVRRQAEHILPLA